MGNKPITVRTLDPPLHEFLPKEEKDIIEIAKEMNVDPKELHQKLKELHEFNPMLGWRGCRLGITLPEITEMQVRAMLEAQVQTDGNLEIMIPIVAYVQELEHQRKIVLKVAEEVEKKYGKKPKYSFGTMIEVPRAAITSDEIAKIAEFYSFGTNDLTQMGSGLSRDDAGRFINAYLMLGILEDDPFQKLDRKGIGELMKICIRKGKQVRPDLKIGICGEHGGEPTSVEFCHMIGLTYVSCSPFRIPIAKVAAAQAAIRYKHGSFLNK